MAESNADKNVASTSSSPTTPDETIKDLQPRVSEQEMNAVKGGTESPKETVNIEYGGVAVHYTQQK
jgi:hypothetical protein